MKIRSGWFSSIIFMGGIVLILMIYTSAFAANDAYYKLPSPHACYVHSSEMPKLLKSKVDMNRHGIKRKMTEGFIIRQSIIKDGKIVIPKAGLLYLTGGGEYFSDLNGEPTLIAGKNVTYVGKQEALAVRKNFFVPYKKRPVPLAGNGTIAVKHTYYRERYFGVHRGTSKYVFANGISGWDLKFVQPMDGRAKSVDTVSYGYMFDDEGMVSPPPVGYFGDPHSASGECYIVTEEVGPKGIKVKEAGAPDIIWFKITYDKPIIANAVSSNQTVKAGKYTLKVLAVDAKKGTAKVALLNSKDKVVARKVLGPLTLDTYKVSNMINHDMSIRRKLMLDYGDIRVQLNTKYKDPYKPVPQMLINEKGEFIPVAEAKETYTFHGDKVDLVIYTNVKKCEMRKPWSEDPRFAFNTFYI